MYQFEVVKIFEKKLCEYTGSKYAVVVNSCTMALLLACKYFSKTYVSIPKYTYVSVPMSVKHAGHWVEFRDEEWVGEYQLSPLPVWDSARRFTTGMYRPGQIQCVSFHVSKILGDTQGGAILHDNDEADAWFRRMRFDGRTEGVAPRDEKDFLLGYHCYMSPEVAARLLWRLSVLPDHNEDLPNSDYPDLSQYEALK